MSFSIKHLFHINAKPDVVFKAINTIEGLSNWWTTDTQGECRKGGIIQFRFGGQTGADMKVLDSIPNEKISWLVVESYYGWEDTHITFLLDENEGKTRVRFSHDNWQDNDDFYAQCCFSWGRYMESLRQYCQTGTGEAFGSDSYRT
jgi:uncharacterized protein YndB with AHSA1/START domain